MLREKEPLIRHRPDLFAVTLNLWDHNGHQRGQTEQLLRHFEQTHTPTLVALQEVSRTTLRHLQEREGITGLAWAPDFYDHHSQQWYYLALFALSQDRITQEGDLHIVPLPFPDTGYYSQLSSGINESMYALWQNFTLDGNQFSAVTMHAAMSMSHAERKEQFLFVHHNLERNGGMANRLVLADFNPLGNPIANHYYALLQHIRVPPWSVRDRNWAHEYPLMAQFWESLAYRTCYDGTQSTAFPRHWWHAWWATFCEYFGYTNPLDNILISQHPDEAFSVNVLGTRLGPFAFSDHRAVVTALRFTPRPDGIITP